MIEFRTGTHNPLTLYVASKPYNQVTGGRDLPGWMRDGEWSVGWLPHEGLTLLAVEAMNAFVCQACPWGCISCSLNRATCECYEHQGNLDEDGRPVTPQPADEPVPVSPPVDALEEILRLAERLAGYRVNAVRDADLGNHDGAERNHRRAEGFRLLIAIRVEDVRAAGVEEGRRLLDETAATASAHAYELGIAEGRRQAALDPVTIRQHLDSEEFTVALRKMVRTGEIVLPEVPRG